MQFQKPETGCRLVSKEKNRLSIKKAHQSTKHVRCDQRNAWVVYDFFEVVAKTLQELNLHNPSKTRMAGATGTKRKRKASTSGRENTSVLLCCSAAG